MLLLVLLQELPDNITLQLAINRIFREAIASQLVPLHVVLLTALRLELVQEQKEMILLLEMVQQVVVNQL